VVEVDEVEVEVEVEEVEVEEVKVEEVKVEEVYGLKIHYNTTFCGHVGWAGQDEVLYKDLQFNLGQFRAMVHDLTTESQRLLMDELLCGNSTAAEPIPSVLCESLHDNLTDKFPG
jgi:hypothetical protein